MNKKQITSDQLMCNQCGTVIPKGQTKCPNPACPTNRPLRGKQKEKMVSALLTA